ncbi:MAG: hypothetical protein LBJ12_01240 [Oscillospiraceae bacterium]|nr:hypothetical protein [Oscillospiraceae bacterium]
MELFAILQRCRKTESGICLSGEVPNQNSDESIQLTLGFDSSEKDDEYQMKYKNISDTRAALFAAVAALELLKEPCSISLWTDIGNIYQYWNEGNVVKWFDGNKKSKKHMDLWKRFIIQSERHEIEVIPWKNKLFESNSKYMQLRDLCLGALRK